ncbi:iron complex outermembrane receptor protein [Dyadobacter jejuensis]|uniref:Iron complex outermembrane receptor protein n=1 Tax=Dyadobacter jejuensis TaxID=1082580 RepID=A0A316AJD4_9BACT|nr:TonB-dependent receptor [Dyadobacter jejuensis]PWJ56980.1 iron complex outermembrane receptor protein [Dyadobacter jejuensis]
MSEIYTSKWACGSRTHTRKGRLLSVLFFLVIIGQSAMAQISVKGKVTDQADGSAIPGATVLLKGGTIGTQTSLEGTYELTGIPDNAILIFSFVGMNSQEVSVGNRTTIDVALSADSRILQEVVVVGYGSQKKSDLTGAITAISSVDFVKGNVNTPEQLIAGKLAGVQITSNGGAPGSGSKIRIRGGSSLSASNDPLIVIDGIPLDNSDIKGAANPLSFINPNDIESFNVLKDASAAAIYGSRAANGVIIITTKKGHSGDKLKVNFSTLFSASQIAKKINVLNAEQFREAVNTHGTETQKALLGSANTDWQDQIYRTSFSSNNNLSLSGAVKSIPYRLSVGYNLQNGILKTSAMDRTSASLGLTPKFFKDHLKVDINVKASTTKSKFPDEGAIGSAIGYDPTQPVYMENDKFGGYYQWLNPQGNIEALAASNPLSLLRLKSNNGTLNRVIANAQFDYQFHFLPELHANWNIGIDRSSTDGKEWSSNLVSASSYTNNGSTGYYTQSRQNFTNQFFLNYVKQVDQQNFNIMVGAENQGFVRENENGTTYGNPDVAGIKSYFKTDYALLSYFGRLNYSLKDKYLATVTVRRDGSSRFAKENRWGTFPSVALAWKINKELSRDDIFSDLKLRFGWGITGQQDLSSGDYPYLNAYTPGQGLRYQLGNTFVEVLRPNAYDPNIKWEQTQSTNFGLDFGLSKQRISGSIDFYQKKTSDLINEIDVPAGSNFSNKVTTNVGTLENTGLEVVLNYTPITNDHLTWDISGNFTYNKRKITALTKVDNPNYVGVLVGGIDGGTGNYAQVHSTGYAPNSFFMYQQVYNEAGAPIEGVFVDRNQDGIISELDRYRYQAAPPRLFLGLSSQLAYKKASVGFVMRSNIGNYNFNNIYANRGSYQSITGSGNFLSNLSANVLETGFTQRTDQSILSDYYVQNASFLRMDNINFGYNLDHLFKKGKIRAQLSLVAQNVFVITKYKGLDPEIADGIDKQVYPRPRTLSLGLNLHF